MKMYPKRVKVNAKEVHLVSFDISKDKLDLHTEYTDAQGRLCCLEDTLPNTNRAIEEKLRTLSDLAVEQGKKSLHVVCETTGGYENKLLRLARARGCGTSYVSGESVSKSKVIESNDTGKTDEKDPRVIMLLAKNDKVLSCRHLSGEYLLLRENNRMYDTELQSYSRVKGQIHFVLHDLFCDYSFQKDFLYDQTGRILMRLYSCNPVKIMESGYDSFFTKMKTSNKRIRNSTITRLWADAQNSTMVDRDREHLLILEEHLRNLWEEFLLHESRLAYLRERIIGLYSSLRRKGALVPSAVEGLMNEFHIARILGETGPLSDFPNARVLLRYAGLNLRERKSGRYKGLVRTSKKGRSSLRNVLSLAVFALVKKNGLFGPYYHAKKEAGMKGPKIMVAVMRKFLRIFFALSKANVQFDLQRVFTCEAAYTYKAAA